MSPLQKVELSATRQKLALLTALPRRNSGHLHFSCYELCSAVVGDGGVYFGSLASIA